MAKNDSESPKIKPTFLTFIKNTLKNLKKLNIKTNQVMVALLIMAAFLIGVLFTKVQYLEKGQTINDQVQAPSTGQPTQQGQGISDGQKVDVDLGKLPVLGKSDAKVTVVEFGDFQCPFCQRWFTESEANLIKDYVDTGKVKFAYRHFAFLGQESNFAAEASECANDQGTFWEFHDYLYKNQKGENQGAFSKENLKGFAKTLGLNTSEFNSCLDSGKHTKKVTDDTQAGQKAGVSGTPTIFVNGQAMVGAQPYATLKTLIDKALSE